MPAYWLKPFGTTQPEKVLLDPDWLRAYGDVNLDRYPIITGPNTPRKPPKLGRLDHVLFHAVGHSRIFGAGEILHTAHWELHPFWKDRFPWVYPVRVDVWVPDVLDGLHTSKVVSGRVLGRLQRAAPYVELAKAEFEGLKAQLAARPTAQQR